MATLSALERSPRGEEPRPGHHADAAHAVQRARAQRRDARRASRPCRSAHGSAAGPDRAGRQRFGASTPTGGRTLPLEELYAGYLETTLARGELIAEVIVPRQESAARRLSQVHDALRGRLAGARAWRSRSIPTAALVRDARIVVSAATDTPTRLAAAENVLRGRARWTMRCCAGRARRPPRRRSVVADAHGSAAYKRELVRVYVARAVRARSNRHAVSVMRSESIAR